MLKKNRPDIKDYFPKDADVTDVVKSALDNPWYKYAGKLDRYIDELLEKIDQYEIATKQQPEPLNHPEIQEGSNPSST